MYQKRLTRKLVLRCLQNGGKKLQDVLLMTTLIKVSNHTLQIITKNLLHSFQVAGS